MYSPNFYEHAQGTFYVVYDP